MKPIKTLTAALLLLVVPALLHAEHSTDHKIQSAAEASYNYRAIFGEHVKIKVNNGVVTLTGTVPDPDQRALAEDTVRNLPGVVQVDNRIKVESDSPEHSDGWIGTKIRTKLLVTNNVSAVNTKVDVQNGVVTLRGTADNAAQKELTTVIVRDIEGVKDVNNRIEVVPPTADSRDTSVRMDDASITAQVKYALLTHNSTSALKTNVTTKDGVVLVEGEASSAAEKDLVTRLAQSVRGVRNVNNQMFVKN